MGREGKLHGVQCGLVSYEGERRRRKNWYSLYSNYGYDVEQIGTVEATIRLADELTQPDTYYYADLLISLAFAMRFWVYAIGIGAAILAIAAFVFPLCAHLVRKMVWQQRSRGMGYEDPL